MPGDPRAPEVKLLPDPAAAANVAATANAAATAVLARSAPAVAGTAGQAAGSVPAAGASPAEVERVVGAAPARQLGDLPRDELNALAEEFGLDPTRYKERPTLVSAIHDRRQLIASMDRDAMLDVVRWGRRPVPFNAGREQIAQEIARVRSMRFAGLSARGLLVLARMRGCACGADDPVPALIKKLRKQEGFFARLNRKRRAVIAGVVANIVGEAEGAHEYQFLPGPDGRAAVAGPNQATIKQEIEEAGLFGGISNRLKKTADSYINQKLDEIEARIDRKLDEIDRRLAEWRDKEVANRLKILKITLWASVIVGIVSLIYSYVVANYQFTGKAGLPVKPRVQQQQQAAPDPRPAVPTSGPASRPG